MGNKLARAQTAAWQAKMAFEDADANLSAAQMQKQMASLQYDAALQRFRKLARELDKAEEKLKKVLDRGGSEE